MNWQKYINYHRQHPVKYFEMCFNVKLTMYQKFVVKIQSILSKFIITCRDIYYNKFKKNTYEKYISDLIKSGYISKKDRHPLKCYSCGSTKFESKNDDYLEHFLCEFDYVCKNCGAVNGHWAYGCWFI